MSWKSRGSPLGWGRVRLPAGLTDSRAENTIGACMSHNKEAPVRSSRTSPLSGSAEIEAMVAHTAPAVLELLKDGAPRSRNAIITALADRHPKEDVTRTLMRLSVTGQLVERERKYRLGPAPERGEGAD
jgi:hypothetical protein